MTTRTIQNLGYGFGDSPATIVAKINGVTVFEGAIATASLAELPMGNPYDQWANSVVSLYTVTSTVGASESLPTSIEVTSGTLMLAHCTANYTSYLAPAPASGNLSSGPDTFLMMSGEVREGVTIDGVEQNYHPAGSTTEQGTWWWKINAGSTIEFNLLVDAGLDVTP